MKNKEMIPKDVLYWKQLLSWGEPKPENVARHDINEERSFSGSRYSRNRSHKNLLEKSMVVYAALCVGGTKETTPKGPTRARKPKK